MSERQYQEKVAEIAQLLSERDEARRELKLALEQWELCIEMSKK